MPRPRKLPLEDGALWPNFIWNADDFRRSVRHTGPVENRSVENHVLDFKRELPAQESKLAKTIAAFANSNGGVVLIGVDEETDTRGRKYAKEQLVDTPAAHTQRVSQAVDNQLAPSTFEYKVVAIPVSSQASIVAVNIQPSLALIAMRGDAHPAPSGAQGKLDRRWLAFPYRQDDHCYWMGPGDVERRILDVNRATQLKLFRLTAAQPANRRVAVRSNNHTVGTLQAEIAEITDLHVVLDTDPGTVPKDNRTMALLPLEAIELATADLAGRISLYVRGDLHQRADGVWEFRPSGYL